VPACINCHQLKDNISLFDWGIPNVQEIWDGCTPLARLFIAKLFVLLVDMTQKNELSPGEISQPPVSLEASGEL
jgi:hypothetical protein